MIQNSLPRRLLPAAAAALALVACLAAPAAAEQTVQRNTAIDQFLERDSVTALEADMAAKDAARTRLRQGASGLGMNEKAKGRSSNAAAEPAPQSSGKSGAAMQRLAAGQWVEGPGFDVTYGHTYESCAAKCVANAKCVMIEFYRPERKCNLYSSKRPTKKGGSSDVAVRG